MAQRYITHPDEDDSDPTCNFATGFGEVSIIVSNYPSDNAVTD